MNFSVIGCRSTQSILSYEFTRGVITTSISKEWKPQIVGGEGREQFDNKRRGNILIRNKKSALEVFFHFIKTKTFSIAGLFGKIEVIFSVVR